MTDPPRPLWRVMRVAYARSTAPSGDLTGWKTHHGYAAELRAIADWLVPEEDEPPFIARNASCEMWLERGMLRERQRLRLLLLNEADRAEAGESDFPQPAP